MASKVLEALFGKDRIFSTIKAEVLARKHLLVSDPSIGKMNKVRWVIEYLALLEMDKEMKKDLKNEIINMLGLSIVPTELKQQYKIEHLPLVWYLAPEVVHSILDKQQQWDDAMKAAQIPVKSEVLDLDEKTFFSDEDKKRHLQEALDAIAEQEKRLGIKTGEQEAVHRE